MKFNLEKIVRCLIVGAIFLSMVHLDGVSSGREAKQMIFMLLMMALFSCLLRNTWITLFMVWTIFLFTYFKFTSGSEYLSNIFFGCILYFITKVSFRKEHINFFINGFLWFVFFNVAYSVVQIAGFDEYFSHRYIENGFIQHQKNIDPTGFMGHHSSFGMMNALAIPLLATRGNKWAWIGAVGLFVPLYIAKTSLCLVMGFAGLLFVLFFKIPRKVFVTGIMLSILMSVVYFFKVDFPGHERFRQWSHVFTDAMIHPITGWGLDSYRKVTPIKDWKYSNKIRHYEVHKDEKTGKVYKDITSIEWWDNPHNLIISLLFEFGFVGVFLFCGFIRQNIMRFKYAVKDYNTIALAGFIFVFLFLSIGHFPIFLAQMAVFIIPAFSLFEVQVS